MPSSVFRSGPVTLAAILLLSLTLPPPVTALRAGALGVDITPQPARGVPLSGYESRNDQPSLGLHDSLFARILVLDDGTTSVALVALDLIGINPGRLPGLLSAAGIDAWLLTATHTHAGPRILNLSAPYAEDRSWPADEAYLDVLERRLVAGVRQARQRLEPVRLAVGRGSVDLAFNRRLVHDDGRVEMIWGRNRVARIPYPPVDPEVGVIRLDALDGAPVALLVNFASHAVVLGAGNRYLSADFPGATAHYLETAFPGAVALFLQGGAGDIDPYVDVQTSFVPVREQGEVLGREAERVARLLAVAGADLLEAAGPQVLRVTHRELVVRRRGAPERYLTTGVDVLQVGRRLALVALPGEPFVDLQLSLKARSPVPFTFLLGYTNGYAGYLPTRAASREGGYGASYGHTLHLEPGVGEDLIEAALDVLAGTGTVVTGPAPADPALAGPPPAAGAPPDWLEAARPNPFNAVTELVFTLATPAVVRLAVFDLRGSRVYTLVNGRRGAGVHRVRWEGVDDTGRPVASGIYLARLHLPDRAGMVRKLLLLR